jgi:hypothetical protein
MLSLSIRGGSTGWAGWPVRLGEKRIRVVFSQPTAPPTGAERPSSRCPPPGRAPCRPPYSVARRLPCSSVGLLAAGVRHSASRAAVPGYRPLAHPALRQSDLHPPCSARRRLRPPSLPALLLGASLLRAGLLQSCRPSVCVPCSRHSASRAVVPRCRPPCPPGCGLHPPCSAPPCPTGSSARHQGLAAPAGLLPARRDGGSRRPPCPCSRLQCSMRLCRVLSCFLSLICLA